MKALKKDSSLRYQTSTEMLVDLKAALKDPEGDFVEEKEYDPTARTQKLNAEEIERANKRGSKRKDNKFIKFIKTHKALSGIIGVILLFFIAFGGTMVMLGATNPKEAKVPNVIGLTEEEAKKQIEDAKLVYEKEGEEYDKEVEAGKVISLRTEISEQMKVMGNLTVKEGSKIFVIISKGQEKTKVPNVKGKEKEEAIKLIEDAKLKAEIVEETSKTVKEGYVISQETDADTEVLAGDTVKIHVSSGTEKVTMVNVIDKDEDEAKTALKAIGITNINIAYEENSSKGSGKVIKQSIVGGSTVEKDASITITVNSYKESKTVSLLINVKALTGGYTENKTSDSSNNTSDSSSSSSNTVNKTVNISVSMDGSTVETRQNIDKNTENLTINVTSTGTRTITVDAGGSKSTKTVDFGSASTVNVP